MSLRNLVELIELAAGHLNEASSPGASAPFHYRQALLAVRSAARACQIPPLRDQLEAAVRHLDIVCNASTRLAYCSRHALDGLSTVRQSLV